MEKMPQEGIKIPPLVNLTYSQVDKVKNLRGGCSFLFRGGGVSIFFFRGDYPPLNPKNFRLRHLLLFKVVRPPVINLWCASYNMN